ncbi:hypothetical protein B4N89_46140 [Embleya scabrispora]|uniref:ADP ribosyltransferase domain-containing protein n=1 Tax=Embleya scabrispora TaxID=159449 RepID=A0A1T3NJH8_9ACTN|nr:hypothetical protein [Embleya scabrispora]OPC76855.1 hypothetical protein B4N89_46140 [Embleya scabrispora]
MASGKATLGAIDVPGMTEGHRASVVSMPHEDRVIRDADRQRVRTDDEELVAYGEAQKQRGKFPLGVEASLRASRSLPETATPASSPRARRDFPDDTLPRLPLSKNQRVQRARRKAKALSKTPQTELRAVGELADDVTELNRLNAALYAVTSDVNALSPADQATCRRVDSAIRRYETAETVGQDHLLYAEVQIPGTVVAPNMPGYTRHAFPVGSKVYVDTYMPTSHSLDAVSSKDSADERRRPVFEIQTRRGMYMGKGATARPQDTGHLLPRAMSYKVAGVREVDYVDDQGHLGSRTVVQLVDADESE